jgi:lipoate-protein ligase A
VLHDDELTYSMVAGVDDGVPRGVSASYNLLCGALVEAYRQLGVDAALTERRRGEQGSPACYLHATPADLSLGAAKLSGSAQVWSGSSVLQHGSFVVSRDVEREAEVFGLDAAARQRLEESTCTIREARRDTPGTEELVRSVVTGVERALGVVVRPGRLSAEELSMAIELEPGFTVDEGSWT